MTETKVRAPELRVGDRLSGGARVIGLALSADVPLGDPNNPTATPYDPITDVAYPIAYVEGGDGVRVFARDSLVTVLSRQP